jgi:hypothetical protein
MGNQCLPTRQMFINSELECRNAEQSIGLSIINYTQLQTALWNPHYVRLQYAKIRTSSKEQINNGTELCQEVSVDEGSLNELQSIYLDKVTDSKFDEIKTILHEIRNFEYWYSYYALLKKGEAYDTRLILISSIVCNKALNDIMKVFS